MFERYTEKGRRAIFFGFREAHTARSPYIDTEHLLLGILHADPDLGSELSPGIADAIRRSRGPGASDPEPQGARADLPLSLECKQSLALAAEEAERLHHNHIDTPHLLLGLLRVENCIAAKLLREHGIELKALRTKVGAKSHGEWRPPVREVSFERPSPWAEARSSAVAAMLDPSVRALENLVDTTVANIDAYADSYGEQRLKRKEWTRKEAMGHLVDWAMVHQQWLIQALTESRVRATAYPDEAAAARYAGYSWSEIVDLWVLLNRLLIHVLLRVPEDKLDVPCRIGIADPVQLLQLVEHYVEHCDDIPGQVVAHLE